MAKIQALLLPKTCAHVDIESYLGVWYEIARFPSFFERDGCYNVQARYSLVPGAPPGQIQIENSCMYEGAPHSIKGTATVVSAAKLQVSFLPFVPYWLSHGNYWILDTDHTGFSLVGDPERKHLWILSRKPHMLRTTYDRLVQSARDDGFDVSRLQIVLQTS
jgi:apolipoprotein D and lipocalin family protein